MKRLSICMIAVFIILTLFPITAMAHPGKTDGNGGHYDRSNGEYHYHHGYSAHDHYDMDGDGEVDCPFDFEDKTEHDYGRNDGFSFEIDKNIEFSESDVTWTEPINRNISQTHSSSVPERSFEEGEPVVESETSSGRVLGIIIMSICSLIVFFLPMLLEKEPFGDRMVSFIGFFFTVLLTSVILMTIFTLLAFAGAISDEVYATVQEWVFSIGVMVYFIISAGVSIMEKEIIEPSKICTILMGVSHVLCSLAAYDIVPLNAEISFVCALGIITAAWMVEVVVNGVDGILAKIGSFLTETLIFVVFCMYLFD